MNIEQLYRDYSVDFVTEGHKHAREGWVNTECPFCSGNPGYHLGYNVDSNYYFCWRCGLHNIPYTLSKILRKPVEEVRELVKNYGQFISAPAPKVAIRKKAFKYPSEIIPLSDNHKRYLQSRNFDPDRLIDLWQLKSTGPGSILESNGKILSYKNRILIPYTWDNQVVSFDTRTTKSGHDAMRYMACPDERELTPRKSILYGKQECWEETGILVEGPTDAWRFGTLSCAISGIKYTQNQLRVIGQTFRRVAVIFDDDPQAVVQANRIVAELKFRGVDAFRVDIKGDPGSMEQSEADYLVKQLIK